MELISIIIPVYNAEKYVSRCIESILAQTYHKFELILINDGSSDKSGYICDEYSKADKRIIVVHKNNGGVSSARNLGIDISKGEYIIFIDSDDYIREKFLENLYSNKFDITVSGLEWVNENNETITYNKFNPIEYNNKEEIDYYRIYNSIMMHGPVSKLFKGNLIRDNNIKFDITLSWGEDSVFVVDYMKHVRSLRVIDTTDYVYVRYSKENTLSTQLREDLLENITYARKYCADYISEMCPQKSETIQNKYNGMIDWLCIDFLQKLLSNTILSKSRKIDLLRVYLKNDHVKTIVSNPFRYLHHSDPYAIALSKISPRKILSTFRKLTLKNKVINFIHQKVYLKLPISIRKFIKNLRLKIS